MRFHFSTKLKKSHWYKLHLNNCFNSGKSWSVLPIFSRTIHHLDLWNRNDDSRCLAIAWSVSVWSVKSAYRFSEVKRRTCAPFSTVFFSGLWSTSRLFLRWMGRTQWLYSEMVHIALYSWWNLTLPNSQLRKIQPVTPRWVFLFYNNSYYLCSDAYVNLLHLEKPALQPSIEFYFQQVKPRRENRVLLGRKLLELEEPFPRETNNWNWRKNTLVCLVGETRIETDPQKQRVG